MPPAQPPSFINRLHTWALPAPRTWLSLPQGGHRDPDSQRSCAHHSRRFEAGKDQDWDKSPRGPGHTSSLPRWGTGGHTKLPCVGTAWGHLLRGQLAKDPEAAKKVQAQAHTSSPRQGLGRPGSLRGPARWPLSASPSGFRLFLGRSPSLHSSFSSLNDELNSSHFLTLMQKNN